MLEMVQSIPLPAVFALIGVAATAAPAAASWRTTEAPTYTAKVNGSTFSFFERSLKTKSIPDGFTDAYREMLSFKSFRDGWDGIESKKLFEGSVDAALEFLALLPADIASPEASASSDGTVDWYWRNGPHAATVTFHKSRRVAYFTLTSAAPAKNKFDFRDSIPQELVESLRRI
jgi:hypothetical protein